MTEIKVLSYAPTLLKLLQGPIYSDDGAVWELLLSHRMGVSRHFAEMGLELHLHEAEGFAFLRQQEPSESQEGPALPRLIRRIPLSYEVTLGCVLLRERLLQFENSQLDVNRLILPIDELREMLRPYFRDSTNEIKLQGRLDQTIERLAKFGFLKELKNEGTAQYEVRRLIKAKLNVETLLEIKALLEATGGKESAGSDVSDL